MFGWKFGNEIAGGIVKGMLEADTPNRDKRQREWDFEELGQTPFLFSSGHLEGLRERATRKHEFESILDHMYRHNATEVDSYKNIENKIIDRYWRS